jgi:putative endonuclease
LYVGVTKDIQTRLWWHEEGARNNKNSFTARYNCYHLVYWEHHTDINYAISREKELKGWSRERKQTLIHAFNPEWKFLEEPNMLP